VWHACDKFKCSFCDHVASTAQNRVTHEKRIHLAMDCKSCRKLFDTEAGLYIWVFILLSYSPTPSSPPQQSTVKVFFFLTPLVWTPNYEV
jgi:predicted anti-sigma-YlaC factor YlaD